MNKNQVRLKKNDFFVFVALGFHYLSSKENLILYLDWLIVSKFYLNLSTK